MAKTNAPRHGSLGFWPRKKAKKQNIARIRSVKTNSETGFTAIAGYKAGMTHVQYIESKKTSPLKGETVSIPVTIIECPPMKILNIKFYKKDAYGLKCISQYNNKANKEMKKRMPLAKKEGKKLEDFNAEEYDRISATFYTQPKLTGIGKKAPDIFEVEISGKDNKEKFEFLKSHLSKEIKASEIFKEGFQVDVHGVSRGRGYSGTTARYNTPLRQHKSEKHKRGIGSLGPWMPLVRHTVLFPSKWGSHLRTEQNKQIVKISEDANLVNPKGGFLKYGLVKNEYIMIKGSVVGKANKCIVLSNAKRPNRLMGMITNPTHISIESKQ